MTLSTGRMLPLSIRRTAVQRQRWRESLTQFAAVKGGDSTWSITKAVPWQDVAAGPTLRAVALPLETCAHSTHGCMSALGWQHDNVPEEEGDKGL